MPIDPRDFNEEASHNLSYDQWEDMRQKRLEALWPDILKKREADAIERNNKSQSELFTENLEKLRWITNHL